MNILLIDDHSLFAEGLRILLKDFDQAGDSAVCKDVKLATCNSCEQALQQPDLESVELILLDYYLPGLSGMQALTSLREHCSNSRIIVVSALDDPRQIREIIDAGSAGFIPKTSTFAVMSAALKLVLAGGTYLPPGAMESKGDSAQPLQHSQKEHNTGSAGLDCLSQRQREVLMQVVQGKPNKVIARTLGISEHTVKAHISASFKLMGVKNRTEAVYAAARSNHQDPQRVDEAG